MKTSAIMLALLLAYALYQFRLIEKRNPEKLIWWGAPLWVLHASGRFSLVALVRFHLSELRRSLIDIHRPIWRLKGGGFVRFAGPEQEAFYSAMPESPIFVGSSQRRRILIASGFVHHGFVYRETVLDCPDLYDAAPTAYEVNPESWTRRWDAPGNGWREIPKDES